MTVLKRIEERHHRQEGSFCRECLGTSNPCDVVKLARRLQKAAIVLRNNGCKREAADCERVMREVSE